MIYKDVKLKTQGVAISSSSSSSYTEEKNVVTAIALHPSYPLVVVAYGSGLVKAFPYPVLNHETPSREITRLAGFASRMAFTVDDYYYNYDHHDRRERL
eukprot:scaffold902_cov254-Ochromonas_danica.AAC.16